MAKLSAIGRQNLPSEELDIEDYSREQITVKNIPDVSFRIERKPWEAVANQLSALFKEYPQIFSSEVCVYFYNSVIYFRNSEGSETQYPLTVAAVKAVAYTQAADGESLYDHAVFLSPVPDDLPSLDVMKKEIREMADHLVALRNAPSFNDSYSGPVLFEGQAVAEVMAQLLFKESKGLIAKRKPIISSPDVLQRIGSSDIENPLEIRMGKKIMSRDLTIKDIPSLKEFNGQKLAGSFEVDADGVTPQNELMLVDQGVLKTLLNGRSPTQGIKKSTGHQRLALSLGGVSPSLGPSVVSVTSANALTYEELKKKLIAAAKEEDLNYAIIIRKFESPGAGVVKDDQSSYFMGGGRNEKPMSRALYVYKVSVHDGSEQLIRTVEVENISIRSFKRIMGAVKEQLVYNTKLVHTMR
ncbi:MAG: metallopeptidase TldD-related protein [Pontiellaceae bacterium]|nr:metallopeptidase TldD-related protein [Pontiellaceae bacterium]